MNMKIKRQDLKERYEWHKWFAWYPVSVNDNEYRWLEYVYRRLYTPTGLDRSHLEAQRILYYTYQERDSILRGQHLVFTDNIYDARVQLHERAKNKRCMVKTKDYGYHFAARQLALRALHSNKCFDEMKMSNGINVLFVDVSRLSWASSPPASEKHLRGKRFSTYETIIRNDSKKFEGKLRELIELIKPFFENGPPLKIKWENR